MEQTVEEKLKSLYEIQIIHSKIDKIRQIRGELPMEIADLEDDITGLETRMKKIQSELDSIEDQIVARKGQIKDAQALIKKYDTQLKEVKNNREYDALSKEIEVQGLDIQVSEKKIKEAGFEIESKTQVYNQVKQEIEDRKADLAAKQSELDSIISETEKEEKELNKRAETAEKNIDERLFTAYNRLRKNANNGLGVVTIQRDSCSGCFNQIPPQRQLDIRQRKKIIVCEFCGRILVDEAITQEQAAV